MSLRLFLPLTLFAAAPLAAQQSVQDFQWPPSPAETGAPLQGPVDPDAPFVSAPRPVATSTPRPAPAVTATPGPAPVATPTQTIDPAPRPAAPRALPGEAPSVPEPSNSLAQPDEQTAQQPNLATLPTASPSSSVERATLASEQSEGPVIPNWLWVALAGLFALSAFAFFLRRRRDKAPPPEIERPVVQGGESGAIPGANPLTIKAEAIKLSRSMMNATLHYRLSVTNRSTAYLSALTLGGDLVSAHNRKPVDQQIADPAQVLTARHEIARLSPGQTVNLDGTLQLPLSQVNPIRQGNAPLFVPLMRWRASSESITPVVRTYVVGNQPQFAGGRLQPFRLDEQPQTYSQIGERAID